LESKPKKISPTCGYIGALSIKSALLSMAPSTRFPTPGTIETAAPVTRMGTVRAFVRTQLESWQRNANKRKKIICFMGSRFGITVTKLSISDILPN
jgi:hypothetical protein